MSTTVESIPQTTQQPTGDAYKGKIHPDWCPGCGDFSVLSALQKALLELELEPHKVITISGIGCSSNLPGFINTYGMHTLHGRSLAVATGVKLGNHELKVIGRETTKAPKSCTAPMKIDPNNTHSNAGSQPQKTAMAGPTIGPVPAMLVK